MISEIPWFVQWEWAFIAWIFGHWVLFVSILAGVLLHYLLPYLRDVFRDWWYDNVTSRKRKNK